MQDQWERFMSHVDKQRNDCWLWTSVTNDGGYGKFTITIETGRQQIVTAHVWAWEQKNGARPVYPAGHHLAGRPLDLDHFRCDNPSCVNPKHVRPTSRRENVLRSNSTQSQRLSDHLRRQTESRQP